MCVRVHTHVCVCVYVCLYVYLSERERERERERESGVHSTVGVHSTFVYIYAVLRVLMICAKYVYTVHLSIYMLCCGF